MPSDPWIWIVALVVLGGIVALALWKGKGANVAFGKDGVSLTTPGDEARDKARVAEGLEVRGTVGNVTGLVKENVPGGGRPIDVDVMNQGVVHKGAQVGDITGARIGGAPPASQGQSGGR